LYEKTDVIVVYRCSFYFNSVGLAYAQVPTIIRFLSTSCIIGTLVTITGNSFNTTSDQNIVFFDAIKATLTASITIRLTLAVPIPELDNRSFSVLVSGYFRTR
jgi:hypothetical protein